MPGATGARAAELADRCLLRSSLDGPAQAAVPSIRRSGCSWNSNSFTPSSRTMYSQVPTLVNQPVPGQRFTKVEFSLVPGQRFTKVEFSLKCASLKWDLLSGSAELKSKIFAKVILAWALVRKMFS